MSSDCARCSGSFCWIILLSSLAVHLRFTIVADLIPAKCYAASVLPGEQRGQVDRAARNVVWKRASWMRRKSADVAQRLPSWNIRKYFPYTSACCSYLFADVIRLNRDARRFEKAYSGRVQIKLLAALRNYSVLAERLATLRLYVDLREALPVDKKAAECIAERRSDFHFIEERLNFLSQEICAIPEDALCRIKSTSKRKFQQYEDYIMWVRGSACVSPRASLPRADAIASQKEREKALYKFRRCLETLTFSTGATSQSHEAAYSLLQSPDAATRRRAARIIRMGVEEGCLEAAAAVLNKVAAWLAHTLPVVDDQAARLGVQIVTALDAGTVQSIEEAAKTTAAPIMRRFYALKKRILSHKLDLKHFGYRDRAAPLPIKKADLQMSWQEAVQTVSDAFAAFSVPMAKLFQSLLTEGRIDAVPLKGKLHNRCFAGLSKTGPFVALSYTPGERSLYALAHEACHGIHALLLAKQGLQPRVSPVVSEMVALLGEIILFRYLLSKSATKEERLAYMLQYLEEWDAKVIKPLVLHRFEVQVQKTHHTDVLTVKKINELYLASLRTYYGEDGDVFDDFEDAEIIWALTASRTQPFYVFSYAAAQQLADFFYSRLGTDAATTSRAEFFSILKANSWTVLTDLLQASGINKTTKNFWDDACTVATCSLLEEAEKLAAELDLVEGGSPRKQQSKIKRMLLSARRAGSAVRHPSVDV